MLPRYLLLLSRIHWIYATTALAFLSLTSTLCAEEPAARVLVANDGVTFYGNIEQTSFGYRIMRDGRPEMISPVQVRCVAPTLEEAYTSMSQEMEQTALKNQLNITADSHFQLAHWCYQYGLYSACKRELAKALKRDPGHARAAELAKRFAPLDGQQQSDPGSQFIASLRTSKTPEEIKQKIFIQSAEAEVTPLANLPKELAIEFQKMQPVLATHCGKGGCHDPTTSREFVFLHLPRDGGLYRNRLEQNMAQLADAIKRSGTIEDFTDIVKSKNDIHHATIFTGSYGKERQDKLTAWSQAYGQHAGIPLKSATPASEKRPGMNVAAGQIRPASFEQPQPGSSLNNDELRIEETLQKARIDHSHDAFDPAAFNRRPR